MCWASHHPPVGWQQEHPLFGLCCHWVSIVTILVGVPSWILKHGGLFDWVAPSTPCMSVCISHIHNVGVMVSTTSTVSMKKWSIVGHRSNHWALFRLVQPSGWGNCPVWDSGGSPTASGSQIPRRFTKCSSTGLHGNPMGGSPGGGREMPRDGPKTLFFIMMLTIVILFTTPSLSQWKAGLVSELLGECAK